MDYYYITYHIDIEALHQDRLLELLNSYLKSTLVVNIEYGVVFISSIANTIRTHKNLSNKSV